MSNNVVKFELDLKLLAVDGVNNTLTTVGSRCDYRFNILTSTSLTVNVLNDAYVIICMMLVVSCSGQWFSTVCAKVSARCYTQMKSTRRGKRSLLTSSARCGMAFGHSSSSSSSREPRSAPHHAQVSYMTLSVDNVAEILRAFAHIADDGYGILVWLVIWHWSNGSPDSVCQRSGIMIHWLIHHHMLVSVPP